MMGMGSMLQRVSTIILPLDRRRELETFIAPGYPHETCGLLMGTTRDGRREVLRVAQAGNLDTERAEDRYRLDPEDFMREDQAARQAGHEILGVWHSHPDHPARPSQTDLDAAWDGWSYLIAEVTRDGVTDMTSWRLAEGTTEKSFVEETIR